MSIRQRLAGALLDLDEHMASLNAKVVNPGGIMYGKLPIAAGLGIRDANELINKHEIGSGTRQVFVDQRNLGVATRLGVPLVTSTAAGVTLQQLINLLSQPKQASGEDFLY